MLELDLILEAFLARHLAGLDAGQRATLAELLEQPDNDLLDLALSRREPEPRFRRLVEMLRAD